MEIKTAFVVPKSRKAKNTFINKMDSVDEVIVEQHKGDKVFIVSLNRKDCRWINIDNDKDWEIEF
jgi:hypothetical protein